MGGLALKKAQCAASFLLRELRLVLPAIPQGASEPENDGIVSAAASARAPLNELLGGWVLAAMPVVRRAAAAHADATHGAICTRSGNATREVASQKQIWLTVTAANRRHASALPPFRQRPQRGGSWVPVITAARGHHTCCKTCSQHAEC